jgi:hypothetical protein
MDSEDPSSINLYFLAYAAHKEAAYPCLVAKVTFLAILTLPRGLKVVTWFDFRLIVWIWTVYIKDDVLLFWQRP